MMTYEFKQDDAFRFAEGKQTRKVGNEIVFRECPYCHGGSSHDKNSFAINLTNGAFNCKRSSCGAKGNMLTLAKDFGFSLGRDIDVYYGGQQDKYKTFTVPKEFRARISDPIDAFMSKRGISKATAEKFHLQTYKDRPNVLAFPFITEDGSTVCCVKYRDVEYVKGSGKSKEWFDAGGKPILFGMDQCDKSIKTLIVTEGQMDSLAVTEAGLPNAVSVPNGCNGWTWVPYCWDFVEQFDDIVVFGDCEHGHISLADEFMKRWRNKIRIVRMEDYGGCKDANDILLQYGQERIHQCVELAKAPPVHRVLRMSDVQKINIDEVEKVPTGVQPLDKKLHGGLPFGGVSVITGKAGDGKSTFASCVIASAISNGYSALIYSGEMPNGVVRETIDRQIAGTGEIELCENQWHDTYSKLSDFKRSQIGDWYHDSLFLYDSDNLSQEEEKEDLIQTITDSVKRINVRVVLLDNLMTAIEIDAGNEYSMQTEFMKKLVRLAKSLDILIILVAHKRKSGMADNGNDEISGSSNIANLAAVTLSYERFNNCGQYERKLKIYKNRLFGAIDSKGIIMTYDPVSKRVSSSTAEAVQEYDWKPVTTQASIDDLPPWEEQ